MKIACEACGARYAIPDEKVRGAGRTFKITCRKCDAPMLVQGIGEAVGAGSSDWYYALGTERHGPVDPTELGALLEQGTIAAETYVWHQGMAEWSHLRDVPALRDAVPALGEGVERPQEEVAQAHVEIERTPAEEEPPTPTEGEADPGKAPAEIGSDTAMISREEIAASHAELAGLGEGGSAEDSGGEGPAEEEEAAIEEGADEVVSADAMAGPERLTDGPTGEPSAEAEPASSPAEESPFGGSADSDDDIFAGAADDDVEAPAGGHGRRETSVLFSLDEVTEDKPEPGFDAFGEDSLLTESSGLLDIRAVAARSGGKRAEEAAASPFGADEVLGAGLVKPSSSGGAGGGRVALAAPIVKRRSSNGPKILAGVAVLMLFGVAGAWWWTSQGEQGGQQAAPSATPVAPAPEGGGAQAVAEGAPGADAPVEPEGAVAAVDDEEPTEEPEEAGGAEGDSEAAGAGVAEGAAEAGGAEATEAGEAEAAEAEEVEEAEERAPVKKARPKPRPKPKPKPEPRQAKPTPEPAPKPRPKPAPKETGGGSDDVNDLLQQLNRKKASQEEEAAGQDDNLPAKLGAGTLKSTLRKRHPAFSSCYEKMADRPPGATTVKTALVISGSGSVKSARITDAGGVSGPVRSCIVSALRATSFPKFRDEQMIVNYPIVLR